MKDKQAVHYFAASYAEWFCGDDAELVVNNVFKRTLHTAIGLQGGFPPGGFTVRVWRVPGHKAGQGYTCSPNGPDVEGAEYVAAVKFEPSDG